MTAVDITTIALSRGEELRLDRLVRVVHDAIKSFVEAGQALDAIRNGRLYRATHSTFEAFVEDEFGYSRGYAYKMIEAAKIVEVCLPVGHIQNERQARELVGLAPEQAREVVEKAGAETGGMLTAKSLRQARQEVVVHPAKERRRRPLPDAFRSTSWDLMQRAKTLEKLVIEDDRWKANAETCRLQAAPEVRRAVEALGHIVKGLGLGELVLLTPETDKMAAAIGEQFEAALTARADDDLSAENVARHLDGAE